MESKTMYRVEYGPKLSKEALFTDKTDAAIFAEVMEGCLSTFGWSVQIEE